MHKRIESERKWQRGSNVREPKQDAKPLMEMCWTRASNHSHGEVGRLHPGLMRRYFSGGAFPPPPAVSNLLSLLPPPKCFKGPFVKLDHLVDVFMKINIPEQGKNQLAFRNLRTDVGDAHTFLQHGL